MGQSEIIELLKKNPDRWFTTKEICKTLDRSYGGGTLKRLREYPINGLFFKKEGYTYVYKYNSSE